MVVSSSRKKPIAAIGNFDGVHLGHQFLLAETLKLAKQNHVPAGVVVFDPHPRRFFRPQDPPFLLTSSSQRDRLIKSYGIDVVHALAFDAELASLSPEEFVTQILDEKLGLSGVVTGKEFQFGAKRAGDAESLKSLCEQRNISAISVEPLLASDDTPKIGSSQVRQALVDGDVGLAAKLLGRSWSVQGKIIEGQKLGRTIGFPTANMILGDLVEPKFGVYAVLVEVDGETYKGVANFGRRPTVGSDHPLLETCLFDFEDDLYGKIVDVSFKDFIRSEQKFDGLDPLKAQIAKDVVAAKKLLAV